MPSTGYFTALAQYNEWANRRLYDAVAQLDEAEYKRPRACFFGSIHATLNHLLVGDRLWSAHLSGRPAPGDELDAILYDDFASLREAREAEDAALIDLISAIERDAGRSGGRRRSAEQDSLDLVLGHVFNHQTHHRGQVHALLSQTAVPPPELDLYYFMMDW